MKSCSGPGLRFGYTHIMSPFLCIYLRGIFLLDDQSCIGLACWAARCSITKFFLAVSCPLHSGAHAAVSRRARSETLGSSHGTIQKLPVPAQCWHSPLDWLASATVAWSGDTSCYFALFRSPASVSLSSGAICNPRDRPSLAGHGPERAEDAYGFE